jgi:hypothetical protein
MLPKLFDLVLFVRFGIPILKRVESLPCEARLGCYLKPEETLFKFYSNKILFSSTKFVSGYLCLVILIKF